MRARTTLLAPFALAAALLGTVTAFAQDAAPPASAASSGTTALPVTPAPAATSSAAAPAAAPKAAPAAAGTPAPADKAAPTPSPAPKNTPAPPAADPAEPWYRFRPQAELGFLAVLSNRVQFGKNGTYFDYQRYGGQDNLYFIARLSMEVEIARQHNFTFLYQPLEIVSRVQLAQDLIVDEARFAKGTAMEFKYGFPFYRFSYLYDFFADDRRELGIGLSAQIRNATIEFATADGEVLKSYRNIGFVPLIKARGRYNFTNGLFIGTEVDAIYAPVRGFNGSDNEVTGALVDASIRVGLKLPLRSEAFLNVRYLAGGATGQSDPEDFSDGRTKNWLQFMTVSLGGTISSF